MRMELGQVSAHPAIGSGGVPDFVKLVELDWAAANKAATMPMIMLPGDDDTIAASEQAVTFA